MAKTTQRMEILGEFRPEDVLPHITRSRDRREYPGADGRLWSVKMWSKRYFTFRESISCVVCGLDGTIMSLERSPNSEGQPHFNLYAECSGGRVLMTKDHIEPKSRGGEDAAGNFQTMCTVCNGLKAHHRLNLSQMKLLRAAYDSMDSNSEFPREIRRVVDGMAARMAADDGGAPMTAGELAGLLLLTPDAVVAVGDSIGYDRVKGVSKSKKGITDSDRLPPDFMVVG